MKRRYTSTEKAHGLSILAQTDGNLLKTSRLTGYPRKSIAYWAEQTGVRGLVQLQSPDEDGEESALSPTSGEQKNSPRRRKGTETDRQEMIERWRKATILNVDELSNPKKIHEASLRDNTIAAGTAQDKLNILTGNPTSITENRAVRYVAADGLQQLASRRMRVLAAEVIDVPALPAGRTTPEPPTNGRKPRGA